MEDIRPKISRKKTELMRCTEYSDLEICLRGRRDREWIEIFLNRRSWVTRINRSLVECRAASGRIRRGYSPILRFHSGDLGEDLGSMFLDH